MEVTTMALESTALLKYAEEEHYCPHCRERLSCCQAPPFHFGDGLGWGSEIFFICLSDECSLFVNSWQQFEEQYGHSASCRYMQLPGEKKGSPVMVGGKDAFKGCLVDPESIMRQDHRFAMEKEAAENLAGSVAEKNLKPALYLLLDEAAGPANRERAIEALVEINDLACIDPIRNHQFKSTRIENQANLAIQAILKANYRKECPHCAEIIKAQAKLCMHCGK
jgi:hypothetical protein